MELKAGSGADSAPQLVVHAPLHMGIASVEAFVTGHRAWIEKHSARLQRREDVLTEEELRRLTEQARKVLPERVRYYAAKAGIAYGRITVRHQKTRWGSCSSRGNLNFNCLLMLTPEDVRDSVVVHELCHRKHMDHSAAFYRDVLSLFPDYKRCNRWLKENGSALLSRLP